MAFKTAEEWEEERQERTLTMDPPGRGSGLEPLEPSTKVNDPDRPGENKLAPVNPIKEVSPTPASTGGGGGGGGFGGFKQEPFKWRIMPAHLVGKELQIRQFAEMYVTIWGVAPPKGYLKALRKKGFNLYEMFEHERKKPAFKHTRFYKQQRADRTASVAQMLGFV